ncbi:hypothetical protein AB0L13_10070 [Saccharopolyspora shandongensis]|uniref:hypothetical protein n=1 Tax=Saccharopolyspora shandongensis TaxID=418495 RepID=UPI00344685FB
MASRRASGDRTQQPAAPNFGGIDEQQHGQDDLGDVLRGVVLTLETGWVRG